MAAEGVAADFFAFEMSGGGCWFELGGTWQRPLSTDRYIRVTLFTSHAFGRFPLQTQSPPGLILTTFS